MNSIVMKAGTPVKLETPLFNLTFMQEPVEINNLDELPSFSLPLVNTVTAETGIVYVKIDRVIDLENVDYGVMTGVIGKLLHNALCDIYDDCVTLRQEHTGYDSRMPHGPGTVVNMDAMGNILMTKVSHVTSGYGATGGKVTTEDGLLYNYELLLSHGIVVTIKEVKNDDDRPFRPSTRTRLTAKVDVGTHPAVMSVRGRHGSVGLFGNIMNTTMLSSFIEREFDKVFGRLMSTVSGGLRVSSYSRQATEEELNEQHSEDRTSFGPMNSELDSFTPRNSLYLQRGKHRNTLY